MTRTWLATEVVQTSAMDCGPAALKCVLAGYGIQASYGRLREACQTDVDGTSIDALEAVAPQLGLAAEQVLIPLDHVTLRSAAALPAIVVMRQADGASHFVVAWRQLGGWLQLMDPATGRRWVHRRQFNADVLRHQHRVPEADWRDWAGSAEGLAPLRERAGQLGLAPAATQALLDDALADSGWFGLGALDAALRLAHSVAQAGGVAPGAAAARLVQALVAQCRAASDDIHRVVPAAYWSVTPDPDSLALGALHLRLSGAVLLRLAGTVAPSRDLAPELRAALAEPGPHPLAAAWALVREQGLRAPLTLAGAMTMAAAALVAQAVLFRGLLDVVGRLALPQQRAAGLVALLVFAALLLALELPIVRESLRLGRHLELRLRMALLAKLPRLPDRYFQSRSVSDMAERSHLLQAVRSAPTLAMNTVQTTAELAFTLLGLLWLAPASWPWALGLAFGTLLLPLALQPLLAERDLRMRNHASALNATFLDALQGLMPARTHRAQGPLQAQQEALLVAWERAGQGLARLGLLAQGVQGGLATVLTVGLLASHFGRSGEVRGADLLLVYWAIKLGALGGSLASLALQLPAQRNLLQRCLEPLQAPEAPSASGPAVAATGAASVALRGGRVVAAGQTLLRELDLQIRPGEHVAIVGASGAGKSTLLGLLLGWHRLADGELTVDGRPLDPAALAALRERTAWLDPAVQLWNRSLLDNLGYASDSIAPARLAEVLDAAQLRNLLPRLPQGLQTPLGEGGALLSGGEGQRVRLGRALLQDDVRLALLDEPFRGLDRGQRADLLAQARQGWRHATLLCVTHDVGETRRFDRVLVVEGGRIVEDAAPDILAADPASRYAALLQAEDQVRREMWQGQDWRHLRLANGRLHEGSAP